MPTQSLNDPFNPDLSLSHEKGCGCSSCSQARASEIRLDS